MSGGQANASQRGLEYYKANPWNGDGNHHEDWLEVLSLEADFGAEGGYRA